MRASGSGISRGRQRRGLARQLTEDNVGVPRLLSDEVEIIETTLDDLYLFEGLLDSFALRGVSHQCFNLVLGMRLP